MNQNSLNYSQLVDRAMQSVIREVLIISENNGLPGEHHFYITINTAHPEVEISNELRAQYSKELTIVLEHQFWDLSVNKEWFSVSLKFNRKMQKIKVPFDAIIAFVDPSVNFGLQFASNLSHPEYLQGQQHKEPRKRSNESKQADKSSVKPAPAEIVPLDNFRKKSD